MILSTVTQACLAVHRGLRLDVALNNWNQGSAEAFG
tara:strand:- start:421 stop:528 length:108 start_codon:yes stop_codon:yes gene_type:complete